jgi:hypothetical protein
MNIAGKKVAVGALVAIIGGVLAMAVSPLVWATYKIGPESGNLDGYDEKMSAGVVALILGIVVLLLVAVWVLNVKIPSIGSLPTVPVLLVVAGLLILLVPVALYFTSMLYEKSLKDVADIYKALGGEVSVGLAFLLEILAGIVVILGGVLGLMKKAA